MIDEKVIRLMKKAGMVGYLDVKASCEVKQTSSAKEAFMKIINLFSLHKKKNE